MKNKKMHIVLIWVLFISIIIGLTGCEITFSDKGKKSYPERLPFLWQTKK